MDNKKNPECRPATFYAGAYATPEQPGIMRIRADFEQGRFIQEMVQTGIANPSWLLMHPDGKLLYAVEEKNPDGMLCAYAIREDGLDLLCRLPSGGADPCHLSLDEEARFLFVANYSSGSLAVFMLDAGGIPLRMTDLKRPVGHGPHATRQEAPHMHFSMMIGDVLHAVDLGTDRVLRYRLDPISGTLQDIGTKIILQPGGGPRHFVLNPRNPELMIVLCELSADVAVFRLRGDEAVLLQTIRSLPADFTDGNSAAAIRILEDGRTVFVSNRGSDCITLFEVGEEGLLTLRQICPTGGRTPRDFNVFGDRLVCANQESGQLTVLRFDADAMTLTPQAMAMQAMTKQAMTVQAMPKQEMKQQELTLQSECMQTWMPVCIQVCR